MTDHARQRAAMVERDLVARGIRDPRVLAAMGAVPREQFVPPGDERVAYQDSPLPIGAGQTISQPFIVALMAEAGGIGPDDRVLEVGTGSGYGAAVLSHLAAEVWTIERVAVLAEDAAQRLAELGYENVDVHCGDGTLGLPEAAPFDAVVVTAGGPTVPEALTDQLADGGSLVIPVGPHIRAQRLVRVRRRGVDLETEDLGGVAFVPLIGDEGWAEDA